MKAGGEHRRPGAGARSIRSERWSLPRERRGAALAAVLGRDAAPGGRVLVEDGEDRLAATLGVDVPAPEEGPLEVAAEGLEHAEDEAVHAVQDAELEDVGAD